MQWSAPVWPDGACDYVYSKTRVTFLQISQPPATLRNQRGGRTKLKHLKVSLVVYTFQDRVSYRQQEERRPSLASSCRGRAFIASEGNSEDPVSVIHPSYCRS